MAHEWSAEVTVDRDLAYRLITGQFDALEPSELRLLSEGWDNTVWLVDGRCWSLLPAAGRDEFLDAYGTVTDAQLLRARVLALFLNATLAVYAHHEGMAGLRRGAIAALQRTAAD